MKHTFFIDLDGTLKTDHIKVGFMGNLNIEVGDRHYQFKKRPHAKTFINELSKLGRVIIFTASSRKYCKKVLEALKLFKEEPLCLTKENIEAKSGIPHCESLFLVDDDKTVASKKWELISSVNPDSMPEDRLIIVPTYLGGEDHNLLSALYNMSNKL